MSKDLLSILKKELILMQKSNDILLYSYQLCKPFINNKDYTIEELDHLEALTARFSRLSDILIQKIFRVIDNIELEDAGTARDRINRAAKKSLIDNADNFYEIRILRNTIAHVYMEESMPKLYKKVFELCPSLFDCVNKVTEYCKKK
jgi:hypothetical protein